jgi:hypothetical protein
MERAKGAPVRCCHTYSLDGSPCLGIYSPYGPLRRLETGLRVLSAVSALPLPSAQPKRQSSRVCAEFDRQVVETFELDAASYPFDTYIRDTGRESPAALGINVIGIVLKIGGG